MHKHFESILITAATSKFAIFIPIEYGNCETADAECAWVDNTYIIN